MSFQYDVSHSKLVNGFSTFQKHWPLAACSCFSVYACSCRDDWPPAARSHANKTRNIIRKLWSSERWGPMNLSTEASKSRPWAKHIPDNAHRSTKAWWPSVKYACSLCDQRQSYPKKSFIAGYLYHKIILRNLAPQAVVSHRCHCPRVQHPKVEVCVSLLLLRHQWVHLSVQRQMALARSFVKPERQLHFANSN
jgi:hypothetical protein